MVLLPRHEHHLLLMLLLLPKADFVETWDHDTPSAFPDENVTMSEQHARVRRLHMCNCRSLVSSTPLFLCFANMQPTYTAFSMNSCASVWRRR